MPTISLTKQRLVDLFLGGQPKIELNKITSDFHGRRLLQEKEKYYAEKEFDSIFEKMFENTGLKIGKKYKVVTYMNPDVDCECTLEHYIGGTRNDRYWLDLMFRSTKSNSGVDIWTGLNLVHGGYIKTIDGKNMSEELMHRSGESEETDALIRQIYTINWDRIKQIELSKEITPELQRMSGIKFGKTKCKFTLGDNVCEAVPVKVILSGEERFSLYLEYTGDYRPFNIREEEIQSITWK